MLADDPLSRADLSNWRSAAHGRWAFRNVERLLPLASVPPASVARVLPSDPADFGGFGVEDQSGRSLDLAGFVAATATDGLLVLRDGRVLFEVYGDGMTPETPHILMSATKAAIGLLVGVLAGEGALDLEAPAARYLPRIQGAPYAGISLRNLLDMRVALARGPSHEADYRDACNWEPASSGREAYGLGRFFAEMRGEAGAEGGPFSYVSENIDLMGLAIEAATGRPVAQLLAEKIWGPMGAASPAFLTLDRQGAPRCTGGLCATLRDFGRLGLLLAEGGRGVVPGAWISDLLEGGDREAWRKGEWGALFRGVYGEMSARAGWYVTHDRPGTLFAMGIHGQNLFVDIPRGLVIAKLSSHPGPFDYQTQMLTHRGVRRLADLAAG